MFPQRGFVGRAVPVCIPLLLLMIVFIIIITLLSQRSGQLQRQTQVRFSMGFAQHIFSILPPPSSRPPSVLSNIGGLGGWRGGGVATKSCQGNIGVQGFQQIYDLSQCTPGISPQPYLLEDMS